MAAKKTSKKKPAKKHKAKAAHGKIHHSKSGKAYKKHEKTGKWVRVSAHDRHPPHRPAMFPGHHKKKR